MTTRVEPEELSALLDGELDAVRAGEVAAQIAIDPALRREFEALSMADAHWRAAAAAAVFTPDVRLPGDHRAATGESSRAEESGWLTALAIAIGGLVILRAVLKLTGSNALSFTLPLLALLLLIVSVFRLARLDAAESATTHVHDGARTP